MQNLEQLKERLARIKERQKHPVIIIKPEPALHVEEEDLVKDKFIELLIKSNQNTDWLLREAVQQLDQAGEYSQQNYSQLINKLIEAVPDDLE